MKRSRKTKTKSSVVPTKIIRKCSKKEDTGVVMVDSPSHSSGDSSEEETTAMDTNTNLTFNVPTTNRFRILQIPIPEPTEYKAPRPTINEKPPEIIVYDTLPNIRLLFSDKDQYGIKNIYQGVKLYCNDLPQHQMFIGKLKSNNIKHITWPYKSDKTKRFVLYGLNTYPPEEISADLEKYGVKPSSVVPMTVKSPRFNDHATYLINYPIDSRINLELLKKAYVIKNTIVRWAHFKPNGDGLSSCSNCSNFSHSKANCGLPPKCGVCSEPHVTNNCPLIINKRAANAKSIAPINLKCPHCSGQHTSRYKLCPSRQTFLANRKKNQQHRNFVDAPTPQTNAWTFPAVTDPKRRSKHNQQPSGNHKTINNNNPNDYSMPSAPVF